MKITISWWNLERSGQTIETLRTYLKEEGVRPWERLRGMRSKFWISDAKTNSWGAVAVWDSVPPPDLPPNRALELIGYPATMRQPFDVEALVEGHETQWPPL